MNKNIIRSGFICWCLFFFTSMLCAQVDSVLLPEATISAAFNRESDKAAFLIRHKADTSFSGTSISLAELVKNDGIYLKNYTLGGLSTAGNRGFGASQTKVYWNGFLLNSPLNGTIDLNLLNIDLATTDVTFVKSNMPVEGGISSSGGSIWIRSLPDVGKNNLKGAFSFGTFDTYKASLNANYKRGGFSNSMIVSFQRAKNDYKYHSVLDYKRPLTRLQGADTKSWQISNSAQFKLKNSDLSGHFSFNKAERGIPPSITSAGPYSLQNDISGRMGLGWERSFGRFGQFSINAGYIEEQLNYYAVRSASDHTSYSVKSFTSGTKWSAEILRHQIKAHLGSIFYKIKSSELSPPDEQQTIASVEVNKVTSLYFYGVSLQKLFVTNMKVPVNYRVFAGIIPFDGFSVSLAHARTNQIPTLNDRYWPISGNVELLTESNLSYEINLEYKRPVSEIYTINVLSSFFYHIVDNWIAWIPVSGDFWQPFNVRKVASGGFDLAVDNKFSFPDKSNISINYNCTLAKPSVTKTYAGSSVGEGNRLIYVPAIQQGIQINFGKNNHSIGSSVRHTGSRYTTEDNDERYSLDAFILWDISYNYQFTFNKIILNTGMKINNLMNTFYETIAYRPMAGRYMELTIGIKI